MSEENRTQEFRLKTIDEIRNFFIEEVNQNELLSKKQKKIFVALNYIENLLSLSSALTGYVSSSTFALLVGIPMEITSSTVGLEICAITA